MSRADEAVGAPERLHPLYLIAGLGRGLRQMLGGTAAIVYLAATGKLWLALLLLVAAGVIQVGALFLYWRRFEFRVGQDEIRIDSGIFSRTHRSIPFDRIQDVDISQGPLARLLNLARVEFETGGSAGDKKDEGALAAVALSRAEAIRDLVRARRGAVVGNPVVTPVEAPPIFAMDVPRVLLAGVFNFSLAVLAGLFGLTQTLGDIAKFDFFSRRFWRQALDVGSPLGELILAHQIVAVIAGTMVLIAIGLVTGVSRTVLRDFRFTLDRTATGLRRRRGLLTLTDVTLPLARMQAALVVTGPLRARFGWHELKLQSLAKDEGKTGDHVVAPLAHDDEIATILNQLGWRPVAPNLAWQRVSSAYAWTFTIVVGALTVPAAVALAFEPLAGGAALVVLAATIAARWLGWRRYRYMLDDDRLLVHSGWWRRRLVILPLVNIQSVDLTENVVTRLFGVASLAIGVASGRGFSRHSIVDLPRAKARFTRAALMAPYGCTNL